jgi:hypothetical protein
MSTKILHPVTQAYAERCTFGGVYSGGYYCWASGGGLENPVVTVGYATESEAWDELKKELALLGRRLPDEFAY